MSRQLQLVLIGIVGAGALLLAGLYSTGLLGVSDVTFGSARAARSTEGGGKPPATADTVESWVKKYGEPPEASMGRLRIPSLRVDAPIGAWAVKGSQMPEPYGPIDVAWYDLSAFPGLGGLPGAGKNAVLGGHVDLAREIPYYGAFYQGPAVFWNIDELRKGDLIEVVMNGQTLRYAVQSVQAVPATGTDWSKYWSSNVKVDTITLFTCGGKFDSASHEYSERTLVRAERTQ